MKYKDIYKKTERGNIWISFFVQNIKKSSEQAGITSAGAERAKERMG